VLFSKYVHVTVGFAMATMVACWPSDALSQAAPQTRSATVDASVDVPATGERAQLTGTATVNATVAAQDGLHYRMSYGCDVAGRGRGDASGDDYAMIGHTTSTVVFDGPLPATVAASCAVELTEGTATQKYDIAVEVSVLPDGTVGAAIVRQVVATR
jgi:hypothetical protein